jgi:hypothetical protein
MSPQDPLEDREDERSDRQRVLISYSKIESKRERKNERKTKV